MILNVWDSIAFRYPQCKDQNDPKFEHLYCVYILRHIQVFCEILFLFNMRVKFILKYIRVRHLFKSFKNRKKNKTFFAQSIKLNFSALRVNEKQFEIKLHNTNVVLFKYYLRNELYHA